MLNQVKSGYLLATSRVKYILIIVSCLSSSSSKWRRVGSCFPSGHGNHSRRCSEKHAGKNGNICVSICQHITNLKLTLWYLILLYVRMTWQPWCVGKNSVGEWTYSASETLLRSPYLRHQPMHWYAKHTLTNILIEALLEPKPIEKIDHLRLWGKEIAIIQPIYVALYTMSPVRHYPSIL